MTKEEAERLEDLRRATGMNTSDTVRTAMEYMHDSIMKGDKNESETEIEKKQKGNLSFIKILCQQVIRCSYIKNIFSVKILDQLLLCDVMIPVFYIIQKVFKTTSSRISYQN